jgi:hypothetical protein
MVTPSDQERPPRWKKHPAEEWLHKLHRVVPFASTSSLAHALVRSLHTCMCVYYSVSTQLCVAATLLLLPRARTHDSNGPPGLNVVTS